MMSYRRAFLLFVLMAALGDGAAAITLVKASTLKAKPASCSDFLTDTAPPVTSYATTDSVVALYFVVSGHKAGDIASVDYIQPDGKAHAGASGPWAPLTSDDVGGQFCFSDTSLRISGASPALQTGQWSAKIYYNSVLVSTLNFTIGSSTPTPSGTNLLKNPGAEEGPASADYSGLATIPGWTTDRNVAVISWTANAGYLEPTSPGPTDRGKNFFAGGYSSTASISQVVDVSSSAATIDGGTQAYTLSGWLGGWSSQDDQVTLTATFKDASGATVGTAKIGPVLAADRNSESGLLYRSASANLPARTRTVTVTADFIRTSGSANDGYADNFGFSLSGSTGGACSYTISPTSISAPASGASGQVQVTTTTGCQWTMLPNVAWITLGSFSTSGTGSGTVSYTVLPNTTTSSRTGTVTIAGKTFTVTQAAPSACTYNVTLSSSTIGAAGGSLRVEIGSSTGCQWTATSDATWARPSVASGSGNGTLSVVVDANSTSATRTARLSIAGVAFTLTQAAASSNCTYNVTLSPSTMAAGGGTTRATITTTSGCQWTSSSDAAWARPTPTSGSGNGTVNIAVDANGNTSSRSARLTIAGVALTLTQSGAAAVNCTFAVSPTTISVSYEAQYGSLEIAASAASCRWSASSSDPWLILPQDDASGSGSKNITYEVTENSSEARTATLTVAGQNITVSQEANPSKTGPAPTVVNAASRMPATLAGGAIARGAMFSVLAPQIGPAEVVNASEYPLAIALAGVSVKVSQGDQTFDAYPVMVAASQVDAILPSALAEGEASLTVTYDGKTIDPIKFNVVTRNFGAFTAYKGSGPAKIQLIVPEADPIWSSRVATAKPNQEVVLWGTGLGPIEEGDNVLPSQLNLVPDAQVTVGGKSAQVLYAGRSTTAAGQDVIRFVVPSDAPSGCYVPVQVNLGGRYGNIVTMSVEAEGKECSDPSNPFSGILTTGRKGGSIFLLRGNFVGVLDPEQGVQDVTLDLGIGMFMETPGGGGEQAFNPLFSMPPPGSCSAYTGNADPAAAGGASTSGAAGALGKMLDAGETITIHHPSGQTVPLEGPASDEEPGTYSGFFGGNVPGSESGPKPLFFTPGDYRVTGAGGRDVGPFEAKLTIPPPVEWTNKAELTTIDRAAGITFTWSTPTTPQRILLGAAATDQTTKATAGFFCVVPGGTGTYTVPPNILANLPLTVDPDPKKTGAVLIFGTLPADDFARFTAKGIDVGQVFYGMLGATLVQVK